MFLASSVVLLLGILTMLGTLVSDLMLVVVDPASASSRRTEWPERRTAEQYFVASSWTLMRRKFAKHRFAVGSAVVLAVLYASGGVRGVRGPVRPPG